MDLDELLYGKAYRFYYFLDILLSGFENSDYISFDQLNKGSKLLDFDLVIKQLADDGMIKLERDGVRITLKGKAKHESGGYKRTILRKRVSFIAIMIGAIAAMIGAIFSLF